MEATTGMALRVRPAQGSSQVAPSAAAVRSTGLRLLHFSNPEGIRGYQPAGIGLSLQNCNHWQDKFFAWILLRQPGRRQLYYYNIVIGVIAFKPNEPGSRKLYE